MPDLSHSRATADMLIRRWGAGGACQLNRNGVVRPCVAALAEYRPSERGLYLDGSERFFISALNLAEPPDFELDVIEWKGKGDAGFTVYKMNQPPTGPRPNGIVVFYDCNVLKIGPKP